MRRLDERSLPALTLMAAIVCAPCARLSANLPQPSRPLQRQFLALSYNYYHDHARRFSNRRTDW